MSRTLKILRSAKPNFRRDIHPGTSLLKQVVTDPNRIRLASRYFLTDIPSAITPATRLNDILNKIEQGSTLSSMPLIYLQQQGFLALKQFVEGEINYEKFSELAITEQTAREHAVLVQKIKEEKEAEDRDAIYKAKSELYFQRREEDQRRLENDPKYIAKIKNQQLRARYGLDQFIEEQFFARLMQIIHHVDNGDRFSEIDIIWLTTEGEAYYTEILKTTYHDREAQFYASDYNQTNNPWHAVSASKHYRKSNQPTKAHNLLVSIPTARKSEPKLNSAISTTHGGVMRDLNRFDEALEFGNQAHNLTPKDFHPCTLLGAVYFEIGNYEVGANWYFKASERGASEGSIDNDLRSIFKSAVKAKREEIKVFLLRLDPVRYSWVKSKL